MAEEYNSFLKKSLDLKSVREERNKDMSRDKLYKTVKKKIQTTMIGSLSTLESSFGFLWGIEVEDEDRTPESRQTRKPAYLVVLEILLQLRLLRLEGHFRG